MIMSSCSFLIPASRLDGDSSLQLGGGGLLLRLRLLGEHRQVALLLEALHRVVQGLAHRPELETQVPELLVRHLVWLLPRVHLVGAPDVMHQTLNQLTKV
uniref:Cncr1 n=1 Tax=Arundo donax TaxID=35708 RepID=A0A0A9H8Q0_ARUDO